MLENLQTRPCATHQSSWEMCSCTRPCSNLHLLHLKCLKRISWFFENNLHLGCKRHLFCNQVWSLKNSKLIQDSASYFYPHFKPTVKKSVNWHQNHGDQMSFCPKCIQTLWQKLILFPWKNSPTHLSYVCKCKRNCPKKITCKNSPNPVTLIKILNGLHLESIFWAKHTQRWPWYQMAPLMVNLTMGWIMALKRNELDVSGWSGSWWGSTPHEARPSGVLQGSIRVPPQLVSIRPNA
jgi:hypothetical protein